MSIIDEIKALADWDAMVAANIENRVDDLMRAGKLSEKQYTYAKSLTMAAYRATLTDEDMERRAREAEIAKAYSAQKRQAAKARRAAKPALVIPEIGQTVEWSGKSGIVTDVQGAGRSALLVVEVNGDVAKVAARFVKVVD